MAGTIDLQNTPPRLLMPSTLSYAASGVRMGFCCCGGDMPPPPPPPVPVVCAGCAHLPSGNLLLNTGQTNWAAANSAYCSPSPFELGQLWTLPPQIPRYGAVFENVASCQHSSGFTLWADVGIFAEFACGPVGPGGACYPWDEELPTNFTMWSAHITVGQYGYAGFATGYFARQYYSNYNSVSGFEEGSCFGKHGSPMTLTACFSVTNGFWSLDLPETITISAA